MVVAADRGRGLRVRPVWLLALVLLGFLAGCGPVGRRPGAPLPWAAPEPALPPVPFHDGPLALSIVHPGEGAEVGVRDRTFVFGAAGTGRAHVTVNGQAVQVWPDGAFLGFLPVPADGVYRVEAVAGAARATLVRRVRLPALPPVPAPGQALIVAGSVVPRGAWTARPGEPIEVAFRGTAGGRAALVLPDGTRIDLVESSAETEVPWGRRVFGTAPPEPDAPVPGLALYRGVFPARLLQAADAGLPRPTLAPLPATVPAGAAVELAVGDSVARASLDLNLAVLAEDRPRVGVAIAPEPDPAGVVHGATGPGHTFHYFWARGTELTLTGERAGAYRVRLAPDLHAWVAAADVRLSPPGTPPVASRVGTVRLRPRPDAVEVRVALARRLPYRIDAHGRSVDITIYGGAGDTRWLMLGGLDPHVIGARWSQPADGVYVLSLDLAAPPWGHAVAWEGRSDLLVRIRRPPALDPEHPLRGLTVAVDAGHPPGGAIGPTGLREAEVNLAVARRLAALLEQAGARAVLTRTDAEPLGLDERVRRAEAAGADLFVSTHENAFPDGVDPFTDSGTSVFFFHPASEALARALQVELLGEFRLRDLGIGRSSLAVVRELTWMPAVLTETMFLMMPEQEAALRDPTVQDRIAAAHLRGLDRFLRQRAREAAGRDGR